MSFCFFKMVELALEASRPFCYLITILALTQKADTETITPTIIIGITGLARSAIGPKIKATAGVKIELTVPIAAKVRPICGPGAIR